MNLIGTGLVVTGEKGTPRQSCAFPGVCVLPSGRWLCSWRAAPMKSATVGQHVALAWSDDEGKTWRPPLMPFVPGSVENKPGLFHCAYLTALGGRRVLAVLCWVDHSDPALPFFNESTEGLLDTRIFLAESADNGATWSTPVLLDTAPFRVPTPITGPILLLPDGCWTCQFELNKHYNDPSVWRHASVFMFSRDEGQSWPAHSMVSGNADNQIFYWDQRPAVLADGAILNLFWTYAKRQAAYLNIHASVSRDNGKTWSAMMDTDVPGQPAQPVSFSRGRIGMVYVDRTAAPIIKLRTSNDQGRTWPVETERIIHQREAHSQTRRKRSMQDAWAEMGMFSIGLPATASLPNGDVLVVYYTGAATDCTDIEWARVRSD